MERKAKELPKLPESECDAAACPATRRMPVSLGIMQGSHDARTSSITGLTQCSNNLNTYGRFLPIASLCPLHAFLSHRAGSIGLSIIKAEGDLPA